MYYPKSQIKTNLYTNGQEFATLGDGNEYQGYYFSTSDNQYFTGKNPNDKPNNKLFILSNTQQTNQSESNPFTPKTNSYYNYPPAYNLSKTGDVVNRNIPPSIPTQTIVLPTEEEYEITEYQRYFVKKSNEIIYIEISQEEYNRYIDQDINVSYQLYIPFTLPWIISGNRNEASNINKKTISRVSNNLRLTGFPSYFKGRYDQYFKYMVGSNLKTDGTEFLTQSTNKLYTGLYHIHPTKGPMVGAEHTDLPHEFLIPVSGSNINYKVNKTETQTLNRRGITY